MSEAGRTRGSYAKTAERRLEIIRAGIDVFSNSGFRSGSIREIAERVGMSQAGLLHHFSNKAELLSAVLTLRDEHSLELMPTGEATEGFEFLIGLVQVAEYNQTVPGLVELHCVLSAEATAADHPAHQYFIDRYRYVVGSTERAMTRMAELGQLRPDVDAGSAARALVALMDGLQVQWLLDRESVDMADETKRFIRAILAEGVSDERLA
ncbi:TetR/AcrR family transcriptional regulator [Galbitalea soli]|uniref:TetR/AcrR family transcriptional regulator n=1 Tax=Galbitalea soli TaxID=1268042 RepID=A0A7C9PPE2_9MICO|nr:TetR/AcrR family transcriptional regulator [Galbitalea soli]NEM92048.1 TetR/AcrR family transcriptional regulator [Galbitalea soli]NYJ32000.1 AcrR family transcriptional regulator [Galbitalea soli]